MHWLAPCVTLFLFYSVVPCENKTDNKQKTRKPLTVLAYLKGYNIGHALKIPAFLISPIIIVSKANREHDTNGQPVSSDENLEENSAIFKKIMPVRIILNNTKSNEENNDIEVTFRQALNRGSKNDVNENKINETIQRDNMAKNNTVENTNQENITTTANTPKVEHDLQNVTQLSSTEATGLYPTAVYNDQVVNTLTITDRPPNYFLLPPLLDEEWKNFTVTANINITKANNTVATENSDNTTLSQSVNETDSTIKGPYPAALYHNVEIDQVSITTNSHTNESPLPPPRDDRWRSFSSLGGQMFSTSSEFRPLAGLYYDGFLHRPLPKNPGFVPYNQYYLY